MGTCASKVSRGGQRGLSLVELMVAMTLGLLVVVALAVVFMNNSNARRELDRAAGVLENGRYAISALSADLALAGYYGSLTTPVGSTDLPCSTAVIDWANSLAVPVHASDQNDTSLSTCGLNRQASSDAIFIQRASTCVAGPSADSGCTAMTAGDGVAYLQVSECGTEYQQTPFVLAVNTGTSQSVFPLTSIVLPTVTGATPTCTTSTGTAPIRRFLRSIYYVDPANILWRLDVVAGSSATPPGTPVQIASDIENMQIEYGVDTTGNGDPDTFSSAPSAGAAIVGARISLLVRADTATPGYQDDKSYQLGNVCSLPTGSAPTCPAPYNTSAYTAVVRPAAAQGYKRHLFTNYVAFGNIVTRMEQ